MADLTANMDFDVLLDFTQPKIIITDTGSYPPGVEQTIIGIVKITQPDGITVEGNFAFADIYWNGVNDLVKATKELRLTAQGKPQQGQYTIVYEISDSVQISKRTKIFQLSYNKPVQVIKESFDVFTPELQVTDMTDYAVSGFTFSALVRLWNYILVGMGSGGGGNLVSQDLAVAGVYYDATYNIALSATITYTHNSGFPYLTIKDQFSTSLTAQAITPPSTDDLLEYVDAIKVKVDADQSCCDDCCQGQCDYILAFTLYRHIRDRICKDQTGGEPALTDLIQQLLNIYYGYVKTYISKNVPILPYTTGDCGDGGGGGGAAIVELAYMVGVTLGAPVDGQAVFTNPQLIDRNIMLFIGSILQSKLDNGYGVLYSKPISSDTITLTGQTWSNGSLVQIFIL